MPKGEKAGSAAAVALAVIGERREDAVALAVLGQIDDAAARARRAAPPAPARRAAARSMPSRGSEPGDPPRDPGAAGADQPGEAEDLAADGA